MDLSRDQIGRGPWRCENGGITYHAMSSKPWGGPGGGEVGGGRWVMGVRVVCAD